MSESGVGGNLVEAPIASLGFTGSEGKSDKVCDPFGPVLGNTYYQNVSIRTSLMRAGKSDTICEFPSSVETQRR